jgi:diaminopimelate decarboxylase
MRHFSTVSGDLYAEGVPLRAIAEAVGTPTYVYSTATLERHYTVFRDAFGNLPVHIAFAVKANTNRAVMATLARLGAGADTVSEGEIRRALAAGVDADGIVFAGVGKTDAELAFAVRTGVRQINVESAQELDRLSAIAAGLGREQAVCLRVNPLIGAGGHAKITTGHGASKFGVTLAEAEELYARATALPGVRPEGLSVHIGSQIVDFAPLEAAYRRMVETVLRLRAAGHTVRRLDLGGGLAATYRDDGTPGPDLPAYGAMVRAVVGGLDLEIEVEPGRMIAANAGVLLTRAVVTKTSAERRFLVLDAAMNDLIRPALYEAYHEILPVTAPGPDQTSEPTDIVGPVCETGDTFAEHRPMPPVEPGELVAIMSSGAYGFTMASTYNSRLLPAEVIVNGTDWFVTRPRQTWDELYGTERLPGWL